MISYTVRQQEINRYKNLIHDFPNSDRRKHWETLLKAIQEEEENDNEPNDEIPRKEE